MGPGVVVASGVEVPGVALSVAGGVAVNVLECGGVGVAGGVVVNVPDCGVDVAWAPATQNKTYCGS